MNHRMRLCDLLFASFCILAFAGCRSANTRLHSLSALPAVQGRVLYTGSPVRVDAVHLPAETDRVEITTPKGAGVLQIHEFDHWAAPLSKMARETLSADLIARLPPGKVILAPLEKPKVARGLDVAILQVSADGGARGSRFAASWQLTGGGASMSSVDPVTLSSNAAETADEMVDRFNELLAQLADRIAAQLAAAAEPLPP